jgi:sugar phosphate isomerase/epimerase
LKLGVGSWTFPWSIGVSGYPLPERPLDAFAILELAESLGVGVVQYADNLPLHLLSRSELLDLRREADRLGVAIEAGTRGIGKELLLEYLEIAGTLGAGLVRTLIVEEAGRLSPGEAGRLLHRVLPAYREENVVLAVENYELYSAAEYRTLMSALAGEHCGVCLDTINNFGTLETPVQVVEQLGEFAVNLHYKDFVVGRTDTGMGYSIRGAPAGRGALEARWLLETIGAHGKCRSVVLEQWVPFLESLEATRRRELDWAREGVGFLRDTMDALGILDR